MCSREVPAHRARTDPESPPDLLWVEIVPIGENDHCALTEAEARDLVENLGSYLRWFDPVRGGVTRFPRPTAHRRSVVHPRFVQDGSIEVRAVVANAVPCRRAECSDDRHGNDIPCIVGAHKTGREPREFLGVLLIHQAVRGFLHTARMPRRAVTTDSPGDRVATSVSLNTVL